MKDKLFELLKKKESMFEMWVRLVELHQKARAEKKLSAWVKFLVVLLKFSSGVVVRFLLNKLLQVIWDKIFG